MRPSELAGNRSRTRLRSCSRAFFDMPSINLPCGPIGTVFESQKSSKLEYEIGIRITRVSIEESPAVSHAFCIASRFEEPPLGGRTEVIPIDSNPT